MLPSLDTPSEESALNEALRAWTSIDENTTFIPTSEGTEVVVEIDVSEAYESDMAEAWPKALARLKTLCETASAA